MSVVVVERVYDDDDARACRLYDGIECACFCCRASSRDDAESQEGAEQDSCYLFFVQHITQLLLLLFGGMRKV